MLVIKQGSKREKVLNILKNSQDARNSARSLFKRLLEVEQVHLNIPDELKDLVYDLAITVDRDLRFLQGAERKEYYKTDKWFFNNIQPTDEVLKVRNKKAFEKAIEYKNNKLS